MPPCSHRSPPRRPPFSFDVHPAHHSDGDGDAAMLNPDVQEGPSSRVRPRSRSPAKRFLAGSTSSAVSSSNAFEISSDQLFVKIPDQHVPQDPSQPLSFPSRSQQAPTPSQPLRPGRQFLVNPEDSGQQHVGMAMGHARKRTLSSGDATSTRRQFIDASGSRLTQSENGDESWVTRRARVLSLPRHTFKKTSSNSDSSEQPSPLTPSAFNDIPPMPIFSNRRFRHRQQDSGATQQSGTSSSIYPRSSSTGTSSYASPPSLPSNDVDHHIITVDPEDPEESLRMRELHEMDHDDVSYRLKLLMQNNYYLPPAHLKPFDYSPVSESPKKSPRSATSPSNFLDIFKVGKLRSKSASPDPKPILRTTADDSTVSGIGRPSHPRPPTHQPQHLHLNAASLPARPRPDKNKKGRVVVVRERVDDIARVAKQVEQELKARKAANANASGSRKSGSRDKDVSNDSAMIDPTDCVDLPPADAAYLLGPHRMGLESSIIGAALLADNLPPHSPGLWSVDSEEDRWRKALLQEAVGHSLNNTPAGSPSRTPDAGTPFRTLRELDKSPSPSPLSAPGASGNGKGSSGVSPVSPAQGPSQQPGNSAQSGVLSATAGVSTVNVASGLSVPRRKRELGQRILSRMIDEDEINGIDPTAEQDGVEDDVMDATGALQMSLRRQMSTASTLGRSMRVTSIGSAVVPGRAETPTIPMTPLLPPPRRGFPGQALDNDGVFMDASDNLVQTEDRADAGIGSDDMLTDAYEQHIGLPSPFGQLPLSPPLNLSPPVTTSGRLSAVGTSSASISSGSHYSDDDDDEGNDAFHTPLENHTLVSLTTYDVDGSRPSLTVSITPSESTRSSSEYSRPSPTTSAFKDALDHSIYSGDESRRQSVANTLGDGARDDDVATSRVPSRMSDNRVDPRFMPVSPPPRTSSSFAHNALYPPPLSRFGRSLETIDTTVYGTPRESMDKMSERSMRTDSDPSTPLARPTFDLMGSDLLEPSLRTVSVAASPIEFFDAVEAQNHSQGDEEDEEEDEEDSATQIADGDVEEQVVGEEEDEDEMDEDEMNALLDEDEDILSVIGGAGYQSDVGMRNTNMFVDPVTRSIRNIPRDPRRPLGNVFTGSLTQLRNHSSPQLPYRQSRTMSDIGYNKDARRALDRIRDLPPPLPKPKSAVKSAFSLPMFGGKGKAKEEPQALAGEDRVQGESFLMIDEAPPRRSTSSVFERLRQRAVTPPAIKASFRPSKARTRAPTVSTGVSSDNVPASMKLPPRPWTSGQGQQQGGPSASVSHWREDQSKQDHSMRRLDGMLIEHMERERDILRRITTTLGKP